MMLTCLSKPSRRVTCIFCRYRRLHSSSRRRQETPAPTPPKANGPPRAKRPHVRAYDGELVPKPLDRPLGLHDPPKPGQNSGRDIRTWKQRRDDFASYDKHLERRQGLIKDLYEKNYFRDIGNLGRIYKGKSIIAPTTPFRATLARYFPNLQGHTLVPSASAYSDTTPALRGRVSVVSVLNTEWARNQCQTFIGETVNPALHELLKDDKYENVAQMVEINVEENWLKWALIKMFMYRTRKIWAKSTWGRYFLVKQGLDDRVKEALGIWNGKVGYVYLVDGMCRVRWAGNGEAREEEKQSLVNCVRRLVDEAKGVQRMTVKREDAKPVGRIANESQRPAVAAIAA